MRARKQDCREEDIIERYSGETKITKMKKGAKRDDRMMEGGDNVG
jgi:hypothetical protein